MGSQKLIHQLAVRGMQGMGSLRIGGQLGHGWEGEAAGSPASPRPLPRLAPP
jgi:hypothetical protein